VLLSADHPLAKQSRVSLKALSEYTLVVTDQVHSWQHVLDLFSFYDLAPAVVHRVRTFELQRSLVANGFGVALIYTRPFGDRSYDGQALVCRPTQEKNYHSIVLAHDQRYPLRLRPRRSRNWRWHGSRNDRRLHRNEQDAPRPSSSLSAHSRPHMILSLICTNL
jgi:DNA-binding transcriptional LysR family regulator